MNHTRRMFLKKAGLVVGAVIAQPLRLHSALSLRPIQRTIFTMGSIATITVYEQDERLANRAIDEAFASMKEVDRLMSVYDSQSQISLINRNAGVCGVNVDPRITEVISQAKRFSALTNGSFDITIEPLMRLYGFRDDMTVNHFPSDKEIATTLEAVGSDCILADDRNSTIGLQYCNSSLDLGGIAVGYALDCAAQALKSHGITSALINHSGDLIAIGTPPEEDGWMIEIINPLHPNTTINAVMIKDEALSTSGNYENIRHAGSKTIGHILNPQTGNTAEAILSSTVIAPTAIEADALSTGCFVAGVNNSSTILKGVNHARMIAMVRDDETSDVKILHM